MLHFGPHEEVGQAIQQNGGNVGSTILFWLFIGGLWLKCMWERVKEVFSRRRRQ